MRIWLHDQYTMGDRWGNPVSPPQIVEFAGTDRFEGQPKLQFFAIIGCSSKVGAEFTDTAKVWQRARDKYWRQAINPSLPNRFKRRKRRFS